jgi:tetratricopeptide (TPR) repeat protein
MTELTPGEESRWQPGSHTHISRKRSSHERTHRRQTPVSGIQGLSKAPLVNAWLGMRRQWRRAHAETLYRRAIEERNRWEQSRAIATIREAIRLQPEFDLAHYQLARPLRELGRQEEATVAFGESVRLRPGHALPHYYLALALTTISRWR